jgi:hypothetical protein
MAAPVQTTTKVWMLEEVHSLPVGGNTYELVRGELFVTPPPAVDHEEIDARLNRILLPFVAANGLGYVYHPHGVIQFQGSQVEPDLMVRQPHPNQRQDGRRGPFHSSSWRSSRPAHGAGTTSRKRVSTWAPASSSIGSSIRNTKALWLLGEGRTIACRESASSGGRRVSKRR